MILRFIILLIAISFVALFAINNDQFVNVNLYPFDQVVNIRSYMMILVSFLAGFLFSIPVFFLFKMGTSKSIKQNNKKIYCLENEIRSLKLDTNIKKSL